MTNFTRCNKVSQVYKSTDKISNFKFKVKFKEVNTVIPLPKFETFASQESHPEQENTGYYEEKSVFWQEKMFRSAEIFLYSDLSNCASDLEKKYNDTIVKDELSLDNHKTKLFSYVHEDRCEYKFDDKLTTAAKGDVRELSKLVHLLNVNSDSSLDGDSESILEIRPNKNRTLIEDVDNNIVKMFILVDMNNPESDPKFLLRRERVLFTLSWNVKDERLTVSPDFNDIDINPYMLEVNYYSKQIFHYSIEHIIDDCFDEGKLAEMVLRDKIELSQKQLQKSKIFRNFILPPNNVLKCLYIIEIQSAYSFEYNNLYVEYNIEVPFGFVTSSPLKGVTQTAQTWGRDKKAHFGHVFELCLNYQMDLISEEDTLSREPEIFFEVISCDMWSRQRTEGYCHTKLSVTRPGRHCGELVAFRPQGSNQRLWEMNRYFVGGRHVLSDLSWLGVPDTLEGRKHNRFGIKSVSTGKLKIVMDIILQSRNFTTNKNTKDASGDWKDPVEHLSADSLFKSVNTVLQAYKHAKEKLTTCQEET